MSRYKIVTEQVQVGPKKTTEQFAVYDNYENRVVVRFMKEKDAEAVIAKYEAAKGK